MLRKGYGVAKTQAGNGNEHQQRMYDVVGLCVFGQGSKVEEFPRFKGRGLIGLVAVLMALGSFKLGACVGNLEPMYLLSQAAPLKKPAGQ